MKNIHIISATLIQKTPSPLKDSRCVVRKKLFLKPGAYDKRIRDNFSENKFTDTGYINFRFIVNCDGEPGRFETIQTDLNLEEIEHHPDLVKHLLTLTAASENWNVFIRKDQPRNYYTYVSYKIVNGKITEILP